MYLVLIFFQKKTAIKFYRYHVLLNFVFTWFELLIMT